MSVSGLALLCERKRKLNFSVFFFVDGTSAPRFETLKGKLSRVSPLIRQHLRPPPRASRRHPPFARAFSSRAARSLAHLLPPSELSWISCLGGRNITLNAERQFGLRLTSLAWVSCVFLKARWNFTFVFFPPFSRFKLWFSPPGDFTSDVLTRIHRVGWVVVDEGRKEHVQTGKAATILSSLLCATFCCLCDEHLTPPRPRHTDPFLS